MRRWLWAGFGALVVAAVAATGYVLLTPKIGHATRAEIEAVLPASLKRLEPPDPQGEARYRRLLALAKGLDKGPIKDMTVTLSAATAPSTPANEAALARIEALLGEGPLRAVPRELDAPFRGATDLKDVAKLIAVATGAAARRHDPKAAARWAALGLRYGGAMIDAGGVVIDELVATAIDAIGVREAYAMEVGGAFDDAGRERLLDLVPPLDGSSPQMAAALRRDFRFALMPLLISPKSHLDFYSRGTSQEKIDVVGTLDPVATARLAGRIHDAVASDLERPFAQAKHGEGPLIDEAMQGLPDSSTPGGEFVYRLRMNSGRNTLGRRLAASGAESFLGESVARSAANRDLLRAVILLRMGRPAKVRDPFTTRDLRVDPRRKLVWSVGRNGKDDGGDIGRGGENGKLDYGFPYGDGSWKPLVPGSMAIPSVSPKVGR